MSKRIKPRHKKPIKKAAKKVIKKPVKKQASKPLKKKVIKKILKKKGPVKGAFVGVCAVCGGDVVAEDKFGRWSDKIVTHAACSSQYAKKSHARKKKERGLGKKPAWLRDILKGKPDVPVDPPRLAVVIKPAGAVKLTRFKRESDKEYAVRVGECRASIRRTKKGRRLSNKEVAYLMLHNALKAYPEIAMLTEMSSAAGYKLRQSRVEKVRTILRKRIRKMLRPINALLAKRGIIEEPKNAETETIRKPVASEPTGAAEQPDDQRGDSNDQRGSECHPVGELSVGQT